MDDILRRKRERRRRVQSVEYGDILRRKREEEKRYRSVEYGDILRRKRDEEKRYRSVEYDDILRRKREKEKRYRSVEYEDILRRKKEEEKRYRSAEYDDILRRKREKEKRYRSVEYEDILRRKREKEKRYREKEKRYRQYDDIDFYRPRLKPAHSDPYLNRYDEDGRRSSRPEYYDDYDRRRVRFSDEVTPPAPRDGPSYSDRLTRPRQRESLEEPILYDWSQSKGGRSRTFTDGDRRKPALKQDDLERPPRAKSATLPVDTGLPLGQRDTGSATRRKKEQYRKELEQQMEEAKAAKKREKAMDQSPGFPGSTKPSAAQVQQPPPQSYTPSFHQQQQQQQQQQQYGNRPQPVSTTPYPGSQYGIQDIQSQVPSYNAGSRPYSQIAQPKEPIGDLGLKEALAKSQPKLLERPFSLNYPQPSTINQPSTNTDPYMYYGMRNPLEPDPNPKSQAGKIWVGEMTKSLSNLGGTLTGKNADAFSVSSRPNKLDDYMVNHPASQTTSKQVNHAQGQRPQADLRGQRAKTPYHSMYNVILFYYLQSLKSTTSERGKTPPP
eukprot:XP_011664380.1 PREDICTED: PERQ amino acid-rich with GYF domain-containing protein 2-like [Strongylocentrotus purpuratus]